jgi:hypothetical protein
MLVGLVEEHQPRRHDLAVTTGWPECIAHAGAG